MKDWSDIFAEELKDIEVTLPEDDWDVVRGKYVATKRRRRVAAWWTGALSSAAAAVLVLLVLFGGGDAGNVIEPAADVNITAQVNGPERQTMPAEDSVEVCRNHPEMLIAKSDDGREIDVVRDTSTAGSEVLVADLVKSETPEIQTTPEVKVPVPAGQEDADSWTVGDWVEEDRPERTSVRKIRNISLAVSGGGGLAGGNFPTPAMDMAPDADDLPSDFLPDHPGGPGGSVDNFDTTSVKPGTDMSERMLKHIQRNRSVLSEDLEHYQPVSYGVSARFLLSKRFSLNTGINYTLYASKRTVTYSDGIVESDRQTVHYLGIPLRFDWMAVSGKHFGMYLGAGTQVDKCIYAKCGSERLYDSSFLWSLNFALGIQYNVTDRFSLYMEPEFTANLNRPQIETYRSESDLIMTARIGLRINL